MPSPSAGDRRFLMITNPSSGSSEIVNNAERTLPHLDVAEIGDDLGDVVGRAIEDGRVIVAAGGDGTVHAVAQHMIGRGVLGVLPGGTLNHFARDLGVEDPQIALETLLTGTERAVDAGRVNEEVFVNNITIGLYPDLVHHRERMEDRIGKWPAMVAAATLAAARARPVLGSIAADGDRRTLSAWIVFVGNNRFSMEAGRMGERARLDEALLDTWVLTADPAKHAGMRAWSAARGGGFGGMRVRTSAREISMELDESRRLAADGEDLGVVRSLQIEVLGGALRVLVP